MRIEIITVSKLRVLLRENNYWQQPILPITRHRALSYINNPRGNDDDAVLFCGYEKDTMTGYLGVLPDRIYFDGTSNRIGLLSAWWVHEDHRKSGIGAFLLIKAFKAYENKLGGVKYNRKSGMVMFRSGKFIELEKNAVPAVEIRLHTHSLGSERLRKYKTYRAARKPLNMIINGNCALKMRAWVKRNGTGNLQIEYCNRIDNETENFIKSKQRNSLFRRNAPELNWIIQYPWVLQAPGLTSEPSNYFFSSLANRFFYLALKIVDGETVVGFLLMKVRNDSLDISYAYYEQEYEANIIGIIMRHALSLNISAVKIFGRRIYEAFIRSGAPYVKTTEYIHNIAVAGEFKYIDERSYEIQGGDGDCVFA